MMPGVFIFGHLLEATENHDGHIVVADLDAGLATNYHGFVNTPYFANEAGAETLFGKIVGQGIPDPGSKRHERTRDLLGRAFTWEYSPGLNSMHLYSTPYTTSWIIPTADGHFATEWCGSGDFVKIRDQLYFARWQEEACNGTLGTVLINMRTMHDAGIGYHMGKRGGLSMSAVGAPARHAARSTSTASSRSARGTDMDKIPPPTAARSSRPARCRRAAGDGRAGRRAGRDGSRAKARPARGRARVEALQRKFLRHLNGTGDCGEFIASSDAVDLGEGLRSIAEDMAHERARCWPRTARPPPRAAPAGSSARPSSRRFDARADGPLPGPGQPPVRRGTRARDRVCQRQGWLADRRARFA
jgi:hypothetical protein